MIKVICFFVILAIYIAWLLIKMELVNWRKLFNLSVSYADSSLYQREPCYSFGWKCRFVAEQESQREPILWFLHRIPTTNKYISKSAILPPLYPQGMTCKGRWFSWENRRDCFAILNRWQFYSWKLFWATLPVFAECSHHPLLHREGRFYYPFGLLFIAEKQFK